MADENSKIDAPKAAPAAAETVKPAAPPVAAKPAEAAPAKPVEAAPAKPVEAAPAARAVPTPAPAAVKPTPAVKAVAPVRKAKAVRKPARKAAVKPATVKSARVLAAAPVAKAAAPKSPARASRKPALPKPAVAKALPAPTNIPANVLNLNQGIKAMFNDTNVAERVQAVFGDVNERAKSAIERNTRIAEELTELGRGNVEAVVASTKVAAKGLETIGQEVAEYGRKSFEDASTALKTLAEVKTPADFFRLQTEFVRGQFDQFVSGSSKFSETVIKLAGEVAEPISSRASVAAERVRTAVAL